MGRAKLSLKLRLSLSFVLLVLLVAAVQLPQLCSLFGLTLASMHCKTKSHTFFQQCTVKNSFVLFLQCFFCSNANHFIFQHCKSLQPVCTVKQNLILFSAVHCKKQFRACNLCFSIGIGSQLLLKTFFLVLIQFVSLQLVHLSRSKFQPPIYVIYLHYC